MFPGPDCPCGASKLELAASFDVPPAGETVHALTMPYARQLWKCTRCGHYVNRHAVDMDELYAGAYVDATYGLNFQHSFTRITALPPQASDNEGRVQRVLRLAGQHFLDFRPRRILDVGSGLCVFLHRMRAEGWECTALDPDIRAVAHAKNRVGVNALHANFLTDDVPFLLRTQGFQSHFDVISFNKVLEHIPNPINMLFKAHFLLEKSGMLYVELPDGECAAHDACGYTREEFHLEHWHAFSMASACLMVRMASFEVLQTGRLREPSGKYTLWLVAKPWNEVDISDVFFVSELF